MTTIKVVGEGKPAGMVGANGEQRRGHCRKGRWGNRQEVWGKGKENPPPKQCKWYKATAGRQARARRQARGRGRQSQGSGRKAHIKVWE